MRSCKKVCCPHCDSDTVKNGLHFTTKQQRYKCLKCNRSFVPNDRNFIRSSIFEIYREFSNSVDEKSIKAFAENRGSGRSTIYYQLKKAGIKNVMQAKALATGVLKGISRSTNPLVAKEIKISVSQEVFDLLLDGEKQISNQVLFRFEATNEKPKEFQFLKYSNGEFDDLGTRPLAEIISHIKRFEAEWIAKSAEAFRMNKRKFRKVHM